MLIEMDKLFSLPLLSSPSPAAFAANRRLLTHSREARKARLSLLPRSLPNIPEGQWTDGAAGGQKADGARPSWEKVSRANRLLPHFPSPFHIHEVRTLMWEPVWACVRTPKPCAAAGTGGRAEHGGRRTRRGREGGSAGRGGKRRST